MAAPFEASSSGCAWTAMSRRPVESGRGAEAAGEGSDTASGFLPGDGPPNASGAGRGG